MRPTSGAMLQHNNNNNCLGQADIMQKCPRTSLLFPSRLELGDLPLVRGLRAWALCSKNRRKAGGLLWGGKAPAAPPLSRRSSTACPRPADVYLSGELGRPAYGLHLGLDARALVTVATLKPSEGGGKTQTRCLLLRTERGSCLYSTAKPSPGGGTSAAPGVVGEWLNGRPGGAESPPGQDGASRVRVRSDRRWRKSGNVATGQERRERRRSGSRTRRCRSASPDTCSHEGGETKEVKGPNPGPEPDRTSCSRDAHEGGETKEVKGLNPGPEPDRTSYSRDDREGGEIKEVKGPNPGPEPDQTSCSRDDHEGGEMNEAGRSEASRTQTSLVLDDLTEAADAHADVVRGRAGDTVETRGDRKPEDFSGQPGASDDEGPASEGLSESFSCVDSPRRAEPSAPQEGEVYSSGPELVFSCFPEPNCAAEVSNSATEDSKIKSALVSLKDGRPTESERRTVEGEDGSAGPDGSGAEASEDQEDCGPEEESWEDEDRDVSGQTIVPRVEPNAGIFNPVALFSPAPSLPPRASMATGPSSLEAEEEHEAERGAGEERRRRGEELEERGSTVAPEEEEEFGVFMQAEWGPFWGGGVNASTAGPPGSRRVAPGTPAGSTRRGPDWTGSFHQSDDTWTAFPQDSSGPGRDAVEQWWSASAVEATREQLPTNRSPASVFAEAFPSPPGVSSCDLHAVPTLTQLLGGRASQDQRLLDHFHDLNKMIGRSYKRASRASRDLLLKTLHIRQPAAENRAAAWTANGHLSPGLPSASQHAAAKRRLSYDYNRSAAE